MVGQYPEAANIGISPPLGSGVQHMPGEGPLTQGGHLMGEMNLLETAATDQRDSLRLVN